MKSDRELADAIVDWIDKSDYETYSLSIGRSRSDACYTIANILEEGWQSTQTWVRVTGGILIRQVDWPETAA